MWPVRFFRCCSLPRSRLLALLSTAHTAARTRASCTSRCTFSALTASHAPAADAFLLRPTTPPPTALALASPTLPEPLSVPRAGGSGLAILPLVLALSSSLRSLSLSSTGVPSQRCASPPLTSTPLDGRFSLPLPSIPSLPSSPARFTSTCPPALGLGLGPGTSPRGSPALPAAPASCSSVAAASHCVPAAALALSFLLISSPAPAPAPSLAPSPALTPAPAPSSPPKVAAPASCSSATAAPQRVPSPSPIPAPALLLMP